MGRRRLIHLQIGLLVLVTLLVVGRSMWTAHVSADRAVVMDTLAADELAEQGFELTAETPLRVQATGSVGRRDADATLAAYAWIIAADSGEPVWMMRASEASARRGTLIEMDTVLTLPAGRYHAYFASFGSTVDAPGRSGFFTRLFREQDHWVNDAGRWRFEIRPEAGELIRRDAPLRSDSLLVFSTGPMGNRQRAEEILEVRASVEVLIRSAGEITADGDARDIGWIIDLGSADTVWTLQSSASVWAGGVSENRIAEESLRLPAGLYAFGYVADNRHAWGGWRGNPPFDPRAWGLRAELLVAADSGSIGRYDPRLSHEPILDFTRIGNGEDVSARFRTHDTLEVVVEAHGEIMRRRFDYGWIETAAGLRVWEMTEDGSSHAGGHHSNRRQMGLLLLPPDAYALRYQSDGSHAYDSWLRDPPDQPERWGIALWTVDAADSARIEILPDDPAEYASEGGEADTLQSAMAPGADTGELIVNLTGLGNEEEVGDTFELESTHDVFVRAVGEITLNNRFDYGWIDNAETGERVWEMTYDNTVSAGGAGRNRLHEGVVKLPAGTYRVGFITDFSHAYGDFPTGEAPDDAAAWGIQVRLFD